MMTTIEVDERFVHTLNDFTDVQSGVNTVIKRHLINLISDKMSELNHRNKYYTKKYHMNYNMFNDLINKDEEFIKQTESEADKKNWENDLIEWEFCIKGMEDWNQKLKNILTMPGYSYLKKKI
jgi:hypothetical protein